MRASGRVCWALVLGGLLGGAACSDDDVSGPTGSEPNEVSPVTLSLENAGAVPIWVQTRGSGDLPSWYTLTDADGVALSDESTCETCSCGSPGCQTCPPFPAEIHILTPGESIQHVWDGTMVSRQFEDSNGQPCDQLEELDGELTPTFDVALCWAESTVETEGGAVLSDPTCEHRSVTLGVDTEAKVVVTTAAPQTASTRFVLENHRTRSIWIQETADCTDLLAWSFVSSAGVPLDATGPCGLCECAAGPTCINGCPGECLETVAREIPAGGDVSWTWDGTIMVPYAEGDWTCQVRMSGPSADLGVDLCYGTGVDADNQVTGVTCSQLAFTRGQEIAIFQVF